MSSHDVWLYLLADLAAIALLARLAGRAAQRIGQPSVIGEMAAGLLLGPSLLGHVWSGGPAHLFPSQVPLDAFANIGLIFFMFAVGMDLDLVSLRKLGRAALGVQLGGLLLPALLGFVVGWLFYDVNARGSFAVAAPSPSHLAFALFLATAMSITAFPVLARILQETGLARTRIGVVALTSAAIDDVCAWILLAAVLGIASGDSALDSARTMALTAGFAAIVLIAVRPLLRTLAARLIVPGGSNLDYLTVIIAGALLCAFATEKIGIHAIFGAFLFGAATPRNAPPALAHLHQVSGIVFLPVFFVVTGLRTDVFTLDDWTLLGWLALVLGIAILGKFAGCGIAARLSGFSARESAVLGVLMDTRGLTELVVLSVGLQAGILASRTYAMMVVMAVVTTAIAAPLATALLRRGAPETDVAVPLASEVG